MLCAHHDLLSVTEENSKALNQVLKSNSAYDQLESFQARKNYNNTQLNKTIKNLFFSGTLFGQRKKSTNQSSAYLTNYASGATHPFHSQRL